MTNKQKTLAPSPSALRIGTRYRPKRVQGEFDAIVIGSGIGGLTTAAIMSKAGQRVLVLEQHYTAGGYTHSYGRNGYEWDVGVHYIGEMGSRLSTMRQVFDYITDGQLKWAPMDEAYDRFSFGDETFTFRAGRRNFLSDLSRAFPKEKKAIKRYLTMLDRVSGLMPLYVADKLLPEALANKSNGLKSLLLPSYFNKTTYEVLQSLTDDPRLISVLTGQMGDCGLPPKESSFIIHALIARHYLNGGYYPIGGASKIAETILPVIQRSGGEVFTYANVERIVIENTKAVGVQMADGTVIKAPQVISNAGVRNTFGKLVDKELSRQYGYISDLQTVTPSLAHLGVYIGLKGSPKDLNLPKTNYWLYPSHDAQANFAAFDADKDAPFPLTYISFPSAKDPSWVKRYPDKSTIEIVAPCPYKYFEAWKDTPWGQRGEEYDALKAEFGERLMEQLYNEMPHLRDKVDYFEVSTPLSTDYFCAYSRGELYGLEHGPERFRQAWLRPKTRIDGLYLTGQDVLSCGVGGAMMGGVLAAASVLGMRSIKLLPFMSRFKVDAKRTEGKLASA